MRIGEAGSKMDTEKDARVVTLKVWTLGLTAYRNAGTKKVGGKGRM